MIYVFCGLSGTGKTILAKEFSKMYDLPMLITCTTRPIRPGEEDGIDYIFTTEDDFRTLLDGNNIIGHQAFEVAGGAVWHYGISKNDIHNDMVAVLTPQGVQALKNTGYDVYSILIKVNEDKRLDRIYNRKDNQSKEEIERRSKEDLKLFADFKPNYILENNGSMKDTISKFKYIILSLV